MNFTSYAQNFEDVLLWRALKDIEHGRYIDIGAQDPVVDSVSLAFYERGWRGIHVEPTPHYAAKLREARPDEVVLEAAVTDAEGPIDFYEIVETGLSTGKRNIAMRHGRFGYEQRRISVPAVRLDKLFQLGGRSPHWLKIDVEGMEPEVLRSWRDHDARPWILVIESTAPMLQKETHREWLDEVLPRGYSEVYFDGLSRYFLHESQRKREAAFRVPANVFDRFSVARHHFSAAAICHESMEIEERLQTELAAATELRSRVEETEERLHEAAETASELRARAELAEQRLGAETAAGSELRSRAKLTEQQLREASAASTELRVRAREADQRLSIEQALAAGLRAQLQHSQDAADAARQEHLNSLQELGIKRAELARLEERAAGLREGLDRARQTAEQLARDHRQDLQNAEQRIADSRAEIGRLEAHSAHMADRLSESVQAAAQERQRIARLRLELGERQSAIDEAMRLIAKLASERPGRWLRFGQALRLATANPTVQDLERWGRNQRTPTGASAAIQEPERQGTAPTMIAPPATGSRNPYLRADSLAELLAWHDVDFVRCAYVTVLGRQPDADGETHYVHLLRQGRSKLEILWHLRRSKEGKRHDPGIAGFDRELKRAASSRSPALGWLVRPFTHLPGDSAWERQLRALENSVQVLARDQQRGFDELKFAIGAAASQPAPQMRTPPRAQIPQHQAAAAAVQRQPAEQSGLSQRANDIFLAMSRVR